MDSQKICSLLVAAASIVSANSAALGAQCVKESPQHSVALIELYTSEGCNSCPPADDWVRSLARSGYTADEVIPLSLHVDYWDQLGWKDRFADRRFSDRQRALAGWARSRAIYTPGVFLNMRELRGWQSAAKLQQAVRTFNAKPALAHIRLELEPALPAQMPVKANFRFKSAVAAKEPQAFVALYENGLMSDVRAGENRGVRLRHDYVVRRWFGPIDLRSGSGEFKSALPLEREWKVKDLGVAAFIQDFATGELFQATALPACGPDWRAAK